MPVWPLSDLHIASGHSLILLPRSPDINADLPPASHPLDVAQLLLVFFKCLPEPLLPQALRSELPAMAGADFEPLLFARLRQLAPEARATLRTLLFLLHRVAEGAEANKVGEARGRMTSERAHP